MNARPPAIGSVMPLPDVAGQAARPDSLWASWVAGRPVATFHCARAALAALLADRKPRRVWLPAYLCPALSEGSVGFDTAWYDVDEGLAIDARSLASGVVAGDAVLAIDYFGRPPGRDFLDLVAARPEVLWIEDRAQALDTGRADWGQAVLFSPRKLVGVGDGGLVVSPWTLRAAGGPPQADASAAQRLRRDDPEGRTPERWYPRFQAQEAAFDATPRPMSPETRDVLARTPRAPAAQARRRNARFLVDALSDLVLWPDDPIDYAPLAVPIRIGERDRVAAALAEAGVFCARHWPEIPSPADFAPAHRLSRELLSLPCDERYGEAEMARIVETLRRLQVRGAR